MLKALVSMPVIGNSKLVEDITKLQKAKTMVAKVHETVHPFSDTWLFDAKRHQYCNSLMSSEEQEIFFMDVEKVDHSIAGQQIVYGIQKYLLG